VKKLIANMLMVFVVIGSVLSSPAIMASSMQSTVPTSPAAVDACALCDLDASDHSQTASGTTTCAAAACAMVASMDSAGLQALPPVSATRVSSVCVHRGRLLDGPEPFPPRHSNA